MALDPCVKSILCTLKVPVLRALDGVIQLVIVEINTQLAGLTASLAILDVTLLPVNLAVGLAQQVIDQFKAAFQLVPVNIMEGCVDLGTAMGYLNDIADKATASLQDFLEDATALLSLQDELNALQQLLNDNLITFGLLSDVIAECVSEA